MKYAGRQYDNVKEFRKYIIYLAEVHTDGRLKKHINLVKGKAVPLHAMEALRG
jgi:hypothetical protein